MTLYQLEFYQFIESEQMRYFIIDNITIEPICMASSGMFNHNVNLPLETPLVY